MAEEKIKLLKSLSIRILGNNNIASAKFENFNSLLGCRVLIETLCYDNNFNYIESDGDITVFCSDELQAHKFIELLILHKFI